MLDVDGTIVPYDYDALPSERVTDAIKKAQEKVIVCLVTGRSYSFLEPVLTKLQMHEGYVVLNNGSQVMDLKSRELLYDCPLPVDEAIMIKDLLLEKKISFYVKQQVIGTDYQKRFTHDDEIKKAYMFFADELYDLQTVEEVLEKISKLPHVKGQKSHHRNQGMYGLSVEHVNATKLHGIETIMKKVNLKKNNVIGVGDGYNDFPLLMACGLKVAMGNAVDDLKAIADYIASTVDEDGLVDVLEKFIL